jgi:hypothetical protein
VAAHFRTLDRLIDDPPALLTIVVLANGAGLRFKHPMLLGAEKSSLEDAEAAMQLVRAQLVEVVAHIDERLDEIVRASTRAR